MTRLESMWVAFHGRSRPADEYHVEGTPEELQQLSGLVDGLHWARTGGLVPSHANRAKDLKEAAECAERLAVSLRNRSAEEQRLQHEKED